MRNVLSLGFPLKIDEHLIHHRERNAGRAEVIFSNVLCLMRGLAIRGVAFCTTTFVNGMYLMDIIVRQSAARGKLQRS